MVEKPNGAFPSSSAPVELSFPLPNAPTTRVHLQLTSHSSSLVAFLTTVATEGSNTSPAPLGSFVYAIPNMSDPSAPPLTTPLIPQPSTLDFTIRVATALARKAKKPVYVGCSVSFAGTGLGGTVEEEMGGLRRCVEVITGALDGRYNTEMRRE